MELRKILKNTKLGDWYRKHQFDPKLYAFEKRMYKVFYHIADISKPYVRRYSSEFMQVIDEVTNLREVAKGYQIFLNEPKAKVSLDEEFVVYNQKTKEIVEGFTYLYKIIRGEERIIRVRFDSTARFTQLPCGYSDKSSDKEKGDDWSERKILSDIMRLLYPAVREFGGGHNFYESYEKLDLKGVRNTSKRLELYKLKEHLDSKINILDIGCNCGFFDLSIADYVNKVVGVEYDSYLLNFANRLKKIEKIENVYFDSCDFNIWETTEKYDLIFSFAVHKHIGMPIRQYFEKLYSMLKKGGRILFETHPLETMDFDVVENIDNFVSGLFEIEMSQKYYDDGVGCERVFYYLKKTGE